MLNGVWLENQNPAGTSSTPFQQEENISNQEMQSLEVPVSLARSTNQDLLLQQETQRGVVNTMKDLLLNLHEEFTDTVRKNNNLKEKFCKKKQEMRTLKAKLSATVAALQKDLNDEREAHGNLKSLYNEIKARHNDVLKKCEQEQVSLAEAQWKYNEAMEARAQLDDEMSELLSHVNTLRESLQQLEDDLSEKQTQCDEESEQEEKALIDEHKLEDCMKELEDIFYETYTQHDEIRELEQEEQDLTDDEGVEDLEDVCSVTHKDCDEIRKMEPKENSYAFYEAEYKKMRELSDQLVKKYYAELSSEDGVNSLQPRDSELEQLKENLVNDKKLEDCVEGLEGVFSEMHVQIDGIREMEPEGNSYAFYEAQYKKSKELSRQVAKKYYEDLQSQDT